MGRVHRERGNVACVNLRKKKLVWTKSLIGHEAMDNKVA